MSTRDPFGTRDHEGHGQRSAVAELWWIPVGAGGHLVIHTSRWWERWRAVRERRAARPLFHAALEIHDGGRRTVIEMAPAWGRGSGSAGVVATGPVGMRPLGALRLSRYEIRCRDDGVLPDRSHAPDPPRRLPLTDHMARTIPDRLRTVPLHTWGRDAVGVGDMWNSNSLVAWLLEISGLDTSDLHPPADGAAPGWAAGVAAAGTRAAVVSRGKGAGGEDR